METYQSATKNKLQNKISDLCNFQQNKRQGIDDNIHTVTKHYGTALAKQNKSTDINLQMEEEIYISSRHNSIRLIKNTD